MLASHGYQHVVNVRGGFGGARDPATGALVDEGWSVAGLPVETTAPGGVVRSERPCAFTSITMPRHRSIHGSSTW